MSGRFFQQFLALIVVAVSFTCKGDVLWWQVEDTATLGGQDLGSAGVESARIRVLGKGVGDDVFLDMYVDNGAGYEVYHGAIYADVPVSAPYFAALGDYNSSAYSFSIELGSWSGDTFNVLGMSDPVAYADLARYISTSGTVFSPGSVPEAIFSPVTFGVPEPSSGLLLLLGFSLLALRRRLA